MRIFCIFVPACEDVLTPAAVAEIAMKELKNCLASMPAGEFGVLGHNWHRLSLRSIIVADKQFAAHQNVKNGLVMENQCKWELF